MLELKRGYFVQSLAGHDKGKIYIINDVKGEYVYLVDGKYKLLNSPKKKKKKHIQIIYKIDKELEEKLSAGLTVKDEDIKKAIKHYVNGFNSMS
ncbi:MAG: 50S ribosomal protein L14 [Lachnospiraceae bacterium]